VFDNTQIRIIYPCFNGECAVCHAPRHTAATCVATRPSSLCRFSSQGAASTFSYDCPSLQRLKCVIPARRQRLHGRRARAARVVANAQLLLELEQKTAMCCVTFVHSKKISRGCRQLRRAHDCCGARRVINCLMQHNVILLPLQHHSDMLVKVFCAALALQEHKYEILRKMKLRVDGRCRPAQTPPRILRLQTTRVHVAAIFLRERVGCG
jgi:hypothetical protein